MTFSALYVLPALAILILIQGSLISARGKHMYRSRQHQRRARHRILFFRALVVALIVATALTKVWPLPPLLEIVQGVMITVAIMTPISVYIVISKLWPQQPSENRDAEDAPGGPVDAPDLRPAHTPAHLLAEETSIFREHEGWQQTAQQPRESLEESLEELLKEPLAETLEEPLADSLEDPLSDTQQPASQSTGKNASTSLHSQSSEQESTLDHTLSVGEQMETLDDLVDFHNIGDDYQATAAGSYDPDAPPVYNPLEKAIAVARDAILDEPGIQDYSTENLPARSRIELSEMVVRLRNDKMKLQKLVIAQKAVIDSEKQAHERTRVVVKDAISVMRHARHGQRIAEKIARRERAERQRLEKDYIKVRRALDNALSTLKAKSERADVEKA